LQALKQRGSSRWLAAAAGVAGVAIAIGAVVAWRATSTSSGPEPAPAPPPPAADAGAAAPPAGTSAPAPTAATARPAPPRPAPEQLAKLGEAVLMARLRKVAGSDPAAAVELAREGNRRFPDSPDAPERESILIHALAALDRPSEARGRAEFMVNHYPASTWVREIEAFTGAHPHRDLRMNDAGQMQYR